MKYMEKAIKAAIWLAVILSTFNIVVLVYNHFQPAPTAPTSSIYPMERPEND